ncbi:MAG TPA: isoaspartyl peptidase/L-asparaginase [Candidatus Binataceae bacterium]|nr:isoaspartyl peptidase/L-asparaginase [Candidatus Binataceae bacterium]
MAAKKTPALIAHGGAGGRAPANERPARRRAMIAAIESGAQLLRHGGHALDAVVATVMSLEDDPLFNAGYGSVLTTEGRVEMDAGVMVAEPAERNAAAGSCAALAKIRAGGVVLVSRVRNPIQLARAVMERTPHLLMGGAGAERLARDAGIRLCRPDQLISERARQRWLALMENRASAALADRHGTVGAVAVDAGGNVAAATSTGGVSGKMPGRIGDSAILGAGLFADARGGASATGSGEAIMRTALCRDVVAMSARMRAYDAAARVIADLHAGTGAEAGLVMVDAGGRFGYAHNAAAMEVAMFDGSGIRHLVVEPLRVRLEARNRD